jgi:uncharacterized protein (TIGR02598 family)
MRGPEVYTIDEGGFSLVEIMLALGVIAIAVLALIGLFPVGFQQSRESQHETRAALLSEQLIESLRSSATHQPGILYGEAGTLRKQPVDLAQNSTNYFLCDSEGTVVGLSTKAAFDNGDASADIEYLTAVSLQTNSLLPSLVEVRVEVTASAAAKLDHRSRYGVVTLLRRQ